MRPENYILWAVVACIAYSFVPPLVRIGTQEVPSNTAALLSNVVLVVLIALVLLVNSESPSSYLTSTNAMALYLAGVFLGIGILSYYRALELGPVSVVVPIFAMFLVGGSVIGFAVFNETITPRKVIGIAFGITAIYLISS